MRLISGYLCPTQVLWLSVLTNVTTPSLRCKAATDNTLEILETHRSLCIVDVFEHPPPRLASWRPIWSDMASVDTTTQWREDWSSASVVNHSTVTDPTKRQPGCNLPRHAWSLLNRFQTGQSPCCANLHKWGLVQSASCDCGQRQTMNHITCPLTTFEGELKLLHEADDDAVRRIVIWLESTATIALAKRMTISHIHQSSYIR